MIYDVGIEDIEPDYYVAWAFIRPGLTGSGKTSAAAMAQLQMYLSNSEVRVAEKFQSFMAKDDPDYRVNAFFKDDLRPLTEAEIRLALDELLITRREFLDQLEGQSPEILARPIESEAFGSLNGIIKHVAGSEWWYCQQLDAAKDTFTVADLEPLDALIRSRERTRRLMSALAGDARTVTTLEETWSARKILRRTLWHERDHTRHIAERLRELSGF